MQLVFWNDIGTAATSGILMRISKSCIHRGRKLDLYYNLLSLFLAPISTNFENIFLSILFSWNFINRECCLPFFERQRHSNKLQTYLLFTLAILDVDNTYLGRGGGVRERGRERKRGYTKARKRLRKYILGDNLSDNFRSGQTDQSAFHVSHLWNLSTLSTEKQQINSKAFIESSPATYNFNIVG